MTSARTLLGPLTTQWTPPPICSYAMALCDTCTTVWYAQTCNPTVNARDFTDCWPPRSGFAARSDPGVMMGWGFYSPGIACPLGYTTAALATAGGSSGWPVEYSLTDGETAAACCPTGYGISTISAAGTLAQTCVMTATTSSLISVQCSLGQFIEFSTITIPATVSDTVLSQYVVFAPLYQLNFQPSDLPLTTTLMTTTTSRSAESSSSASPVPTSAWTTTLPSSTLPGSTQSGTTVPGSVIPGPTVTKMIPGPGNNEPTSSGGFSDGAMAGIGVAVALGLGLLMAVAFWLWRRGRRGHSSPDIVPGPDTEMQQKKETHREELPGEDIKELDGRPVQAELSSQGSSSKNPKNAGPEFRRSDQNWVIGNADADADLVSPLGPQPMTAFELDGTSTPPSGLSPVEQRR